MKTTALLLALMINLSVFAQGSPSYTQVNSNTVKVVWYHENGEVRETGYFLNGDKNGVWEQFNEKGVKISEANFSAGVKDGNWSVWNDQGALTYYMLYENGKRILTTQWDDSGKLIAGTQAK